MLIIVNAMGERCVTAQGEGSAEGWGGWGRDTPYGEVGR